MSRVDALIHLGLSGQDFGPCYADEWTHAEFAAMWRGSAPCPSEGEIEAAEAAAAFAAHNSAIKAQIVQIERETIENRGSREAWLYLILKEAMGQGKAEADLLDPVNGNSFYQKLKETDDQIRALRSQLP